MRILPAVSAVKRSALKGSEPGEPKGSSAHPLRSALRVAL